MVEQSIERNDVDISKLMTWRKDFTLFDHEGNAYKVYIRLVGDAEINQARVYALRKSAELRKKLRDPESDEYFAYIPMLELLTKDRIVDSLIYYRIGDVQTKAYKDVRVDIPKEPNSEATLEEHEEYQKLIDAYPAKVKEAVNKFVENELEKFRKDAKKRSLESLYDELVIEMTDHVCETEMLAAYRDKCAFFGTYKDVEYKERLFGSFDDFLNLPTDTKSKILECYNSLEQLGDNLKN
jgi:hypothetical protein